MAIIKKFTNTANNASIEIARDDDKIQISIKKNEGQIITYIDDEDLVEFIFEIQSLKNEIDNL